MTSQPADGDQLLSPGALRLADLIVAVAFAALGTWVMVTATGLRLTAATGPGPGMFPFLAGAVLLVAGAVLSTRQAIRLRTRAEQTSSDPRDVTWTRPVLTVVLYVGYLLLLNVLGFVLATAALLFGMLTLVARRPLWSTLAVTICAVVVLRVGLGELLDVPLPLSRIAFLQGIGL